ncbi:MAG: PKD domain-containing protein [Candidatus Limnocylindria bacterium]
MHDRTSPNPAPLALAIGLAFLMAASALLAPHPVRGGAAGQKVVIIVGPVGGGSIQTNYLNRGESIADAVEALGGTAVRVFSPNATWANAKAAVNGANIIVYIGHGSGYPNPYGSTLLTDRTNGWGLNRIAGADAADPTGHGHNLSTQMVYCGEAALEGKALTSYNSAYCSGGPITPAQGFVMVYSNACYAPGAGETEQTTPSSEATALARVGYFSRPILALGGTYFASDLGSRSVVEAILENPDSTYADIFAMGNGYSETALRKFPHPQVAGSEAWIQKTQGPGGLMSYWYAFAGNPYQTPTPAPPVADFTASPTAGIEQLWVAFANESSTFGPTTWAWDFDNNGTTDSTSPSPVYTYPSAGTYSVTLTVTNSLGTDTMTRTNYISVTTPQPATYLPLEPARLLDTRFGNGLSGPFSANLPRTFQVTGRGGVPANATAVTGNLTVTAQTGAGYVYLGPSPIASPPTSTLNFPLGDTRANGVTMALGPGGTLSVTFGYTGTTHLVFDVTGYFVPDSSGATYAPVTPARLLDTRYDNGLSGTFAANVPRTFQVSGLGGVPMTAVGVTGNLTVTQQTAPGYIYLGPNATASPTSSTLNFPTGDNRANNVTLALGAGGTLSATYGASGGTTHLIFDVTGYFVTDGSGAKFVPLTPSRLLDSRFGNGLSGPFNPWIPRTFQVHGRGGVPATAVGVTGNLTVTGQTQGGATYFGPNSESNPSTSTLNFPVGDSRANGVNLALGPGGTLSGTYMAQWGQSHHVFDVTGYFRP